MRKKKVFHNISRLVALENAGTDVLNWERLYDSMPRMLKDWSSHRQSAITILHKFDAMVYIARAGFERFTGSEIAEKYWRSINQVLNVEEAETKLNAVVSGGHVDKQWLETTRLKATALHDTLNAIVYSKNVRFRQGLFAFASHEYAWKYFICPQAQLEISKLRLEVFIFFITELLAGSGKVDEIAAVGDLIARELMDLKPTQTEILLEQLPKLKLYLDEVKAKKEASKVPADKVVIVG